jgi:phosphopantothenoylcysteine decarboxylase/phosphopantothenate--cysteine ligase
MAPRAAGKRVVLGVTGGIAAYKAVEVCRRLVDAGVHVMPVLTDDALRFVGEATFSALASERCRHSLWDDAEAIPHIRLGQVAELIVVVPATARFIGSYAGGIADGLLLATVLATRAPVVVCPAMHTEMWEHPSRRTCRFWCAEVCKSFRQTKGDWPGGMSARGAWPNRPRSSTPCSACSRSALAL